MSKLALLKKLLSASPHELATRGKQELFARKNEILARLGRDCFRQNGHISSLGIANSDLTSWISSREDRLLPESAVLRAREEFSNAAGDLEFLVQSADEIVDGGIYMLGHGVLPYQGENRWRSDHVSNIVSPVKPYNKIRYLDPQEVGDSKYVWEPNRFGWVYKLGSAYVITGNDGYAQSFQKLANDWLTKNPYPWGINYCSALEVSLRIYAMVWGLQLFRKHLRGQSRLLGDLLRSIWIGCHHVERNLSEYFAPNTHLTGEAFALFACGAVLPEFRESPKWRKLGIRILEEQAKKQFHQDGTHKEQSSCYHLYSTDFYLQAHLIAKRTGFSVSSLISQTARSSSKRLAEIVRNDMTLPQFNDCDGGRLTWFALDSLDANPTLQASAQEFGGRTTNPNSSSLLGYHTWLADPSSQESRVSSFGKSKIDVVGSRASAATIDSGIVGYRNDTGDYLLFRAGPFGYMDCGHSHDAPLSVVLDLGGLPVIVDSGTGAYTQSREIRDRFRSAQGKNTILLNGRGPSTPAGWFNWEKRTSAELNFAQENQSGFACQGTHLGFSEVLNCSAKVTRNIAVLDVGVVVVADRWQSEQPVECESRFTLDPYWEYDQDAGALKGQGGQLLHTCSFSCQTRRVGEAVSILPDIAMEPYSPSYGNLTQTLTQSWKFGSFKSGGGITIFSRIGQVDFSLTEDGYRVSVGASRFLIHQKEEPDSRLRIECISSPTGRDRGTN